MTNERRKERKEIARISILMARPHVGFDFKREDFRWTESALHALGGKDNIPGATRTQMLWEKFENPMLGIYTGLLHLRRRKIDVLLMRRVFNNLHNLVGPLPDVLAIGWGVALRDEATRTDATFMAKLRSPGACATPPMLRESWEHLLRVSAEEGELIPARSLADRISGRLIAGGPWVAWLGELPPPGSLSNLEEVSGASIADLATLLMQGAELTGAVRRIVTAGEQFLEKLRGGLGGTAQKFFFSLAEGLSDSSEARFWLPTKRFSELERRVAYWLQPSLDPQLSPITETDPNFEQNLSRAALERAADTTALLTELNLSWPTALRAAWGLFIKLFVQPVIPDKGRLQQFAEDESRGNPTFTQLLRGLGSKASRIHHQTSGRELNLLEFAYLYYRGSPAEELSGRVSTEQLVACLDEAGFVFSDEQRRITALELSLQHAELRQEVLHFLERTPRKLLQRFPPNVLPSPEQYPLGNLLSLLEGETADTAGDSTNFTEPILEVRQITKTFPGVQALKGVDLRVWAGQVHALMGENGAGKSTLMKCLTGIYAPDSGTITFKGERLTITNTHYALSKGISMIHQELNPIPQMTVAENIYLGREPVAWNGLVDMSKMNRMAAELLERLHIKIKPTAKMCDLSIANIQLAEIANSPPNRMNTRLHTLSN